MVDCQRASNFIVLKFKIPEKASNLAGNLADLARVLRAKDNLASDQQEQDHQDEKRDHREQVRIPSTEQRVMGG